MCLITNQATSIINEKPIRAYKVLTETPTLNIMKRLFLHIYKKYSAPIMEFDYTNYVYSHNLVKGAIPKVNRDGVVNEGFHLFISLGATKDLLEQYPKGFRCRGVVFECEIPSNSHCFVSYDDLEICTNQFRFIKEIKI